jgi:hypothetical protein
MHGICGYGTIGDLGTANADHLLHLNIPHLGPQAQDHVPSSRLRELVAKATLHTKPGSGAGKVGSFISTKGQWTSSLSEIPRPSKNQRPYKQIIIITNPVLTVIFGGRFGTTYPPVLQFGSTLVLSGLYEVVP